MIGVIATLLYDWPCAVASRLTWLAPLLARVTVGWVFATTGWGKLIRPWHSAWTGSTGISPLQNGNSAAASS